MCNLETEGVQYTCGHYVITETLVKHDCGNPCCVHSRRHVVPCRDCTYHDKFMGPDRKETIIRVSPDFCSVCHPYWQQGRR